MKYKKPKYSNYKKFNKGMSHGSSSNKRWWIIGGIAAVVIATIIAVIVVVAIQNRSEVDPSEQQKNMIKEIQIARTPDKLTYFCNTPLDTTGLTVYSLTHGGTFTKLNLEECTITGFDSSVAVEEQVITVTYKGFTDTFIIQIKEEPVGDPVLESIEMGTLPKTAYKRGEALDVTGGTFICKYSDGTTKTVDLSIKYTSGFMPAMNKGVGEHDITVKYEEGGIVVQTTYKITITQ